VIFLPQFFLRQSLTVTNSLAYTMVLAIASDTNIDRLRGFHRGASSRLSYVFMSSQREAFSAMR